MRQRIRSFVPEWQKWLEERRQLTYCVQARTPDDSSHDSARHYLSRQWKQGDHFADADRAAAFEQWCGSPKRNCEPGPTSRVLCWPAI